MSRDFLIEFSSDQTAKKAEEILNSFIMEKDKAKVFNVDNRGSSLFVELIYSSDIRDVDSIRSTIDKELSITNFKKHISFVAIKNGEHNGIGYFVYNPNNINTVKKSKIELKKVRGIIEQTVLS